MIRGRIHLLILPLVLLVAAMLTVALIITQASTQLDREADSLYRSFIRSSITHELTSLRDQALDYAWWDDAVKNLLLQQNLEWADANIGRYLYDHFAVDASLVVTADNQIPIGFIKGELRQDLEHFSGIPALDHLLERARNASLLDPKGAAGLIKVDGLLYLVGAFAFTPESTEQTQRAGIYRSVLLLMQAIDADFIQKLGTGYNLQLHSLDLSAKAPGLLLSSALDEPLATLSYQPPRPGEQLLNQVTGSLLGLMLIFLLLLSLSAWIIAKVTRLNRRIELEKKSLQQARLALQQAHDQMELTVEQRTSALQQEVAQHRQTEQELLRTERRFKTLTDESTAAILVHRHSQPLYANPALLALLNLDSLEQIQALESTLVLWSDADQERVERHHEARLCGEPAPKEYILSSHPAFGPQRQLSNRSFCIDWGGESAICTLLLDITESLQTQAQLQQAKASLEQRVSERTQALAEEVDQHRQAQQQLRMSHEVLKSTSEAVVVTDNLGVIVDVNQAYCQLTGFSPEQVLGQNPSMHQSGRHDSDFYQQMWSELVEHGQWRGEVWDRRSNGEIYPKWLSISAIKDDNQHTSHYVGVFSDITERKDQEKRLQRLALYDALTNLPNRLLFKERVEQKLLKAKRDPRYKAALLFIDLDHFKDVNDSLGHIAGDQLLIEVGQRIQQCMRSSDTVGRVWDNTDEHIVARMGGDEFTIAIDYLENNDAVTTITERLRVAFTEAVILEDQPVFVSISIGISVFPDDGESYEQLVKNADKAMYRSKRSGRNQFNFFSAEMDNIANGRIELESGLRQAIREQTFILHYQPKVDAQGGVVNSMEALIRWQHPDKGLIPPGDFIQVAEDTGLIVPIGEWVIDTACHQVMRWSQQLSRPLKVAVNLSARQFRDPQLLEKIIAILKRSGLPPQQLELEVTESVMIEDIDAAIQVLSRLRETGISVAVDDFGTGYSSLSYLRKLPLDTLKIDRSFTAKINQDPKMAAIVEAIIRMGHSLNLEVVAEGVETHQQQELLQYYGCRYLQGFLFSQPLETSAMLVYLQRTTTHTTLESFNPSI